MRSGSFTRREFLRLAGAGAGAAALGALLPEHGEAQAGAKPNIVLILADDLGYGSLGCYGFKDAATPNIDSIASDGVRCAAGYVTCPVCSPTRAGLMTGRYQQRFGHEDNPGPPPVAAANFGLPETEKTLGDYLKSAGYVTGCIGKWHLGHRAACHPMKRGFGEFFGFLTGAHSYVDTLAGTDNPLYRGTAELAKEEYLTDALAREAVSFIDRRKHGPFFLYLPFNAVHDPLQAPERYKDSFPRIAFPRRRSYAGMLRAMDDAVGKVLAKLRSEGLDEKTLVFFLGDNGGYRLPGESLNTPLRGFKGETFEGGVRVPFMARWKGKLPAGKVYGKPVLSLDVTATALAAAGADIAPSIEGVNILPHLSGQRDSAPRSDVYWRFVERSGARVGDWKLVNSGGGAPMLFNLAEDPAETNDLSKDRPEKLKELQEAYRHWDERNVAPRWLDWRRAKKPAAGAGDSAEK